MWRFQIVFKLNFIVQLTLIFVWISLGTYKDIKFELKVNSIVHVKISQLNLNWTTHVYIVQGYPVHRSWIRHPPLSYLSIIWRYSLLSTWPSLVTKHSLILSVNSAFSFISYRLVFIIRRKNVVFLAHLSWKLKWAFLIACHPSSVCL